MIWRWLEGFSGEAELPRSTNGQWHLWITGSLVQRLSVPLQTPGGKRRGNLALRGGCGAPDSDVPCDVPPRPDSTLWRRQSGSSRLAACQRVLRLPAQHGVVPGAEAWPWGVGRGKKAFSAPKGSWWDALPAAGSLQGNPPALVLHASPCSSPTSSRP